MITYQEETWSFFYEDAKMIFPMHWRELALDQDTIPMDIDTQVYADSNKNGRLVVITVRQPGELLGYLMAWVLPHPHYKKFGLMASVDMFYLLPPYRKGGTGAKLLIFAEDTLRRKGVKKVSISHKLHQDHSELFKRLGWSATDVVYTKLLGSSK